MNNDSPAIILYDSRGIAMAVSGGILVPTSSSAILMAGMDTTGIARVPLVNASGTLQITGTLALSQIATITGSMTVPNTVTITGSVGTVGQTRIHAQNCANVDAFGRWRVTSPETVFESQFTYGIQTLIFEPLTSGSGATVAHDTTNRSALFSFASSPSGSRTALQSYSAIRYQSGKSQLVAMSFNFNGGVNNVLKFLGYSDGINGMEFQLSETIPRFAIYSATNLGNQFVTQSSWNIDKLDGTGLHPEAIDFTKTQILVFDFQALYAGRVRMGFESDGNVIYAHEFHHDNHYAFPYIQTANLPIRAGMTCWGTTTTSMSLICSTVVSEGGFDNTIGYDFATEATATAGSGVDTHILSIQPRTSFNGFTPRARIIFDAVEVMNIGVNPVVWSVCIGQALTSAGTTNVNTTYSTMDAVSGTLSGSPGIVILQGYAVAGTGIKSSVVRGVENKYPITLDAAGAVRDLGRITVLVKGIGGTSAGCRAMLHWREIR